MNGGKGVALMSFPFFRQGNRIGDNGVGENNLGRRINQVSQNNLIRRSFWGGQSNSIRRTAWVYQNNRVH